MLREKHLELALKKESEIWLYSYADLITNLLAFFLMMLAISRADPASVQKIRDSLAKATGNPVSKKDEEFATIISQVIRDHHLTNNVAVEKRVEGTSLTFSGGFFFDSSSATLTEDAKKVLDSLIPVFLKVPKDFRIDVEGHADPRPLNNNDAFASNWELSAARAGSVVRHLESKGVQSKRLRAIGYADTRPVSESFEQNRRVVITLGRGLH